MQMILGLIFGLAAGAIIAVFLVFLLKKTKDKDAGDVADRLKGVFASLSSEALSKNSEDFLRLAQTKFQTLSSEGGKDLLGKKELIDQTLGEMKGELAKVKDLVDTLEKDRVSKFSQLSEKIEGLSLETSKLQVTADHLKSALASTKTRGQWGERMAEDVLRLAGFIEGVNYAKQKAQGAGRPDYTFFLPQGLKVNMDVKFPLDNYMRFFDATGDQEREGFKAQFLRDVKQRIKEVTSRDYIDPEQKTVDYVIVFIPNEQVYGFINQSDRTILDEAMRQKVIFCSPLTLYAILAVIRQAMDTFNLGRTTHQILSILDAFKKQYLAFCDSLEEVGTRIEKVQEAYEALSTTRKNQLEKQLKKIEDLRQEKGITFQENSDESGS